MKITSEENDLLLTLAAEFDYAPHRPGYHILVADAARLWGLSARAATFRLDKLVIEGKWGKETVIHQGRPKNGYYIKGKEKNALSNTGTG